jgi:hypothetical protein
VSLLQFLVSTRSFSLSPGLVDLRISYSPFPRLDHSVIEELYCSINVISFFLAESDSFLACHSS